MELSHLIVGNSEDYHAVAVAWALRQMGHSAVVWDGIAPDPDGRICLKPDDESAGFILGGKRHAAFRSVWFRRPVRFRGIDAVASHTMDFVKGELRYAYSNLAAALEEQSPFIVGNGFMDAVACKDYQLRRAKASGFRIPRTLITNSFDDVSRFIGEVGKIALKPFNPFFWHDPEAKNLRVASTAVISSPNDLTAESVQVCPSIYQEFIEKAHELRVTVIGNRVFTARISRAGGGSFIDWRMKLGGEEAIFEPEILAPEFEAQVVAYVRKLGLAYGCLDFVVGVDGEPYFLEINPAGQFLFVEDFIPEFRLLEAFSAMLMAGSFDYRMDAFPDISLARFEQTDDHTTMQELRGQVVVQPPLYGKVSCSRLEAAG